MPLWQWVIRIGTIAVVLVSFSLAVAQVAGPDQMIKGVSFVRLPSGVHYDTPEADSSLHSLKVSTCANWITITPVWWQRDAGSSQVYLWTDSSPSDSEIRHAVRLAHQFGLRVFLKPEVRCSSQVWIGRHHPKSLSWFDSYRTFITRYARLAQEETCELFSIGYALDSAADEPEEVTQWLGIIDTVRKLYTGRLTYAADWRTYRQIGFWDAVDYIGINAYFPLEDDTQSVSESVTFYSRIWEQRWIPQIQAFLDSLGTARLPVVFTEIGYRSIRGCAGMPWDDTSAGAFDGWEQRCCYVAALHSLLGKPWFAGWFWREWLTSNSRTISAQGYDFRSKPAQEVLRRWNSSIATHRGACLPAWADYIYSYPRTYLALCSLAAFGADWVTIHARWMMNSPGPDYDTIKPVSGHSPTDSSIRCAIRWARGLGLNVSLNCYIACLDGRWCNDHDPGNDRQWFKDESVFVTHYATIAEQESCEMLNFALEINRTMDSPDEAQLWTGMILPAVRRCYSGPLAYGSIADILYDDPALPPDRSFWGALDIVGFDWYAPLFPKTGYPPPPWSPRDSSESQTPSVDDLLNNPVNPYAWRHKWIIRLESLYHVIEKPLMFTEIGYRSVDSTACWPWQSGFWGWKRMEPNTTADLYAVYFPADTLTGYVVGAGGTILRTVDGGVGWLGVSSGTTSNLYSVHFPVPDTGYVVGEQGTILRLQPGGVVKLGEPLRNTKLLGVCFPAD
ncbi:MAG: hypothetical protein ABIK43_06570, partial [candidate division WOR-3 bacterium]